MNLAAGAAPEPAPRLPFTTTDMVGFRNTLESLRLRKQAVLLSPDGGRFVSFLATGDLAKNGQWVEIIAGGTGSLEEAANTRVIARLFTAARRDNQIGVISPTHPSGNQIQWLEDNERVAFLWNDGYQPTQIFTVNVRTGAMEQLSHHPTPIRRYGFTPDGTQLAYVAAPPFTGESERLRREGFAVASTNYYIFQNGDFDGKTLWYHPELFVVSPVGSAPRQVDVGDFDLRTPPISSFSPDGRYFLCELSCRRMPAEWSRYRNDSLQHLMTLYREVTEPNQVMQLGLVDIQKGSARPLLAAPNLPDRAKKAWSPDGRSVVAGPVFLPLENADARGIDGTALVEIEIASGKVAELPYPDGVAGEAAPQEWGPAGLAVLVGGKRFLYRRAGAGWKITIEPETSVPGPKVCIELQEGLNLPPRFNAIDAASGAKRMILDLNPGFVDRFALGQVAMVTWPSRQREWKGRLYYPAGYQAGRRYPFVIQTHGHASATEYSLGGLAYVAPAFIAQVLASHGFAVLQMEDAPKDQTKGKEAEVFMDGYLGAVSHFEQQGLIDPQRVGLAGFSRTGWHVEYALTHCDYPFAAALVADNIDGSYVQAVTGSSSFRIAAEVDNGGKSYGDGLNAWMRQAPGFNVQRISTPLRMEIDTGGAGSAFAAWEIFSTLSYLKKPVELVIAPDGDHADHPMQIPRQRVFSHEGALDWWRFWLKDEEDPDPAKQEQYVRWRKLRELRDADKAATVKADGRD